MYNLVALVTFLMLCNIIIISKNYHHQNKNSQLKHKSVKQSSPFSTSSESESCSVMSCNPMNRSWSDFSMEFSRQEFWSGLLFPSSGNRLNLGIEPRSSALEADSLPSEPPGKPLP